MRNDLDAVNRAEASNVKDVLIAETALCDGFIFVTNDGDLAKVATDYGCKCVDMADAARG